MEGEKKERGEGTLEWERCMIHHPLSVYCPRNRPSMCGEIWNKVTWRCIFRWTMVPTRSSLGNLHPPHLPDTNLLSSWTINIPTSSNERLPPHCHLARFSVKVFFLQMLLVLRHISHLFITNHIAGENNNIIYCPRHLYSKGFPTLWVITPGLNNPDVTRYSHWMMLPSHHKYIEIFSVLFFYFLRLNSSIVYTHKYLCGLTPRDCVVPD